MRSSASQLSETSLSTFSSFTGAGKRGVQPVYDISNEMQIQEEILDLDSYMQNMHAAIEHASMAANMFHNVSYERDYRMDVARMTKEGHICQLLGHQVSSTVL
ncbi:hypothetical protein AVEN_115988-1 [Araneus ventricosus]|uniref:Uncharacterized protein n=1 Tax=Araneus ventricosus TaxID=182803 RepID=A0A4Y2EN04_ARAVE|nr:hypothetical protein AVEN_115988-1 [Araneus ventricosus]